MKNNFSDYFDAIVSEEQDIRINTHISSNQSVSSFEVPLPPSLSSFNPNIESFPSQSTDTTSSSMTNIDYASQTALLEIELKKNENNPDILFKLIFLYKKQNRFIDFENTVLKAFALCPLSEQIWKDFFNYKLSISSSFQQKYALIPLFKTCLDDFYYAKIVVKFLKHLIALNSECNLNGYSFEDYKEVSQKSIEDYFTKFIRIVGIDVKSSSKIYDLYLNFEIANNANSKFIFDIWKERLTYPQIIIDIIYKDYLKWEDDKMRIKQIEQIYKHTSSLTMNVIAFDEKFTSLINEESGEENANVSVLKLIKDNFDLLTKINKMYIVLYYEKSLEKFINDFDLWNAYIDFISQNQTEINSITKSEILKRAYRCCNNNIIFTILYLREMEIENANCELIEKQIETFLSLTSRNFISANEYGESANETFKLYKCEVTKYNIEYNMRKIENNNNDVQIKKMRNIFKESIESFTSLNMIDYVNIAYHMWAEFECYKSKDIAMLNAVMTSVCENDRSINTYRAYIYYIKSIGNLSETRRVYKKAYDAFEGEEREMFKKNWLTWEKTFGNAKSINEAISYTKTKDKNMRIFNKIKIIIKNISSDCNEANITQLMNEKCPLIDVNSVRVVRDENGISRKFAFVDLNTENDAKEVISQLNGIAMNNGMITCAISKEGKNDERTVFVNNISYESTKEEILNIFSQYGPVLDVRIIMNPQTNKPRGYCYVEFSDEDSVNNCIEKTRNEPLNMLGRRLKIEKSQSAWKLRNKVKFVAHIINLSFDLNEEELESFLVNICEVNKENIEKVLICRDEKKKNKSKGYGFIEFNDRESLMKTIEKSGSMLKGRSVIITESKRSITEKKNYVEDIKIEDNDKGNELSGKKRKRGKQNDNDDEEIDMNKKKMNNNDFKKLFNN